MTVENRIEQVAPQRLRLARSFVGQEPPKHAMHSQLIETKLLLSSGGTEDRSKRPEVGQGSTCSSPPKEAAKFIGIQRDLTRRDAGYLEGQGLRYNTTTDGTAIDLAALARVHSGTDGSASMTDFEIDTSREIKMPQFDATIKHMKDGIKGFTISAAVKNIEGWEATLGTVESPGAKTIVKDLEALKKHLQADEIDGGKVKELVLKLGKETVAIAGKTDSKNAAKIKSLGEALGHVAESAKAA